MGQLGCGCLNFIWILVVSGFAFDILGYEVPWRMMLELRRALSESLRFGLVLVPFLALVLFLLRLCTLAFLQTGTDTGLSGNGRWVTFGLVLCGAGN